MEEFVKVASENQITDGSIRPFKVNGIALALANLDGQFYAIADVCTHDGGDLGAGEVVDGCCVECPRHGGKFDLKTGQVKALPPTVPVKTYEVKVEGGDVFVKL